MKFIHRVPLVCSGVRTKNAAGGQTSALPPVGVAASSVRYRTDSPVGRQSCSSYITRCANDVTTHVVVTLIQEVPGVRDSQPANHHGTTAALPAMQPTAATRPIPEASQERKTIPSVRSVSRRVHASLASRQAIPRPSGRTDRFTPATSRETNRGSTTSSRRRNGSGIWRTFWHHRDSVPRTS